MTWPKTTLASSTIVLVTEIDVMRLHDGNYRILEVGGADRAVKAPTEKELVDELVALGVAEPRLREALEKLKHPPYMVRLVIRP